MHCRFLNKPKKNPTDMHINVYSFFLTFCTLESPKFVVVVSNTLRWLHGSVHFKRYNHQMWLIILTDIQYGDFLIRFYFLRLFVCFFLFNSCIVLFFYQVFLDPLGAVVYWLKKRIKETTHKKTQHHNDERQKNFFCSYRSVERLTANWENDQVRKIE